MDTYSSWEDIVAINRNSIQPLYRQVKEELERWIVTNINEGNLSAGDRLPSEKELSSNLGVSSITVKRALDELRRQGLIQRIQGRGSFVAQRSHIVLNLNRLFSLTEHVREVGMLPERITLEIVEARALDLGCSPPIDSCGRAHRPAGTLAPDRQSARCARDILSQFGAAPRFSGSI